MKSRIAVSVAMSVSVATVIGLSPAQANPPELHSAIVFSSTRDNPTGILDNVFNAGEIYLMDPATNPADQHPMRLTNDVFGDAFPTLSPDGKRIVFDRNAIRTKGQTDNFVAPDLFLMNTDGTEQTHLTRGSSAAWSPDSKTIVFDASASGSGQPINGFPGAATSDSDIFVVNVGDLLDGEVQPTNITNNPLTVDDDPDWSPDGLTIVFTSHLATQNPLDHNYTSAEIYTMKVESHGIPVQPNPQRLTFNNEEERAPSWSPDGTRIAYMCNTPANFQICLITLKPDGTVASEQPLTTTNDGLANATPTWSPDGTQIVFHRALGGGQGNELFLMTLRQDGSVVGEPVQLTNTVGMNLFANWGVVRTVPAPGLKAAPPTPQPGRPLRSPARR